MRNESNNLYLRLSPENANWINLTNCGNPLLERPIKVFEIFRLFLLGLGYTIKQHARSSLTIKKSASANVVLNSRINEATNSCNLIDFFTPN